MRTVIVTDSFVPRVDGIAVATQTRIRELAEADSLAGVLAISTDPSLACEVIPGSAGRYIVGPFYSGGVYPIAVISSCAVARLISAWQGEIIEIHTVGAVGIVALRVAEAHRLPVRLFWHTDLVAYAEHFPVMARMFLFFVDSASRAPSQLRVPIEWIAERFLSRLLRQVECVVAPSLKAIRTVRGLGYTGQVELLRTTLDIPGATVPVSTAASEATFLYLGRLSREKNLRLLLDAFELVLEERPEVRLRLVGPTDDRRTLRTLQASQRRHPRSIEIPGAVRHDRIREEFERCVALVSPSLTEMQGLAVREAIGLGVLVLVGDRELAAEYAGHGQVRPFVPDALSLAQAMLSVLREQSGF